MTLQEAVEILKQRVRDTDGSGDKHELDLCKAIEIVLSWMGK